MALSLHPDDPVRVINTGTRPLVFQWNSRQWNVPPGERATASFAAVANAFGDPRSGDQVRTINVQGSVHVVPARRDEIHRLRQLYGQHFGAEDSFDPAQTPTVRVIDDEGNDIPVVVNDPTGSEVISSPIQTISQQESLFRRIELLERQNRRLEDLLGELPSNSEDASTEFLNSWRESSSLSPLPTDGDNEEMD